MAAAKAIAKLQTDAVLLPHMVKKITGTKLVVGDGPQRATLESKYPAAVFAGACHGEDLARHFVAADVFVFPSLTDTFGLVLLEGMAPACWSRPILSPGRAMS